MSKPESYLIYDPKLITLHSYICNRDHMWDRDLTLDELDSFHHQAKNLLIAVQSNRRKDPVTRPRIQAASVLTKGERSPLFNVNYISRRRQLEFPFHLIK
jgi:hypothetical protein